MSEEKFSFQAEVARLLAMMVNSVYSDKEVFLRELISNASDACDKLRYQAITDPSLIADDPYFKVVIRPDKKAKTLEISDNGIGMSREEMIDNLGTIARSGTSAFVNEMTGDDAQDVSLIGQFGVGFYSVFMVAEKVEVTSRKAGASEATCWASDGLGEFTVADASREARGTTILVHLKKDAKDWAKEEDLSAVIKKYADHIDLPIVLAGSEKEKTINAASAIWTRPKKEITEEQYKEFYHHVGHAFDDPWLTVHYKAEGKLEYTGLLYIPSRAPHDLFDPARRHRVKLYVKRVFITDEVDGLVPPYLRFLRGVVDTEDLQLNLSREMLQTSPMLSHLRKAVTRRVLTELKKKAEKKPEEYATFWEGFGAVLKEGIYEDTDRRKDLLALARFRSTAGDDLVSLADYIARMKDEQKAIYYITGEELETLKKSPQLEGFKARGLEVLLLTDPVDDFWLSAVFEHEEKPFTSVTRGGADLSDMAVEKDDKADKDDKASPILDGDLTLLVTLLKQTLGEEVKDVRKSDRLTDSPVCLVADEGDMDMRMERMLKMHGQLQMSSTRILEINADHAAIKAMAERAKQDGAADALADAAHLLLDQARIIEGENLPDPAAFSRRLSSLMAQGISL